MKKTPSQQIDPAAARLSRRSFLRLAAGAGAVLAAPGLFARGALAANAAGGQACADGAASSFTAASAQRAGSFVLFSDVHFDPFADPGKVKALAGAPVEGWGEILAAPGGAFSAYGRDSNNALFQSFLNDMAQNAPRPDFLLFPGDMLCHRFWTSYPKLTGDASAAGLLAFIEKTAAYFYGEIARRFPEVPLYPALGNNDSFEGDYHIAPKSPFLATTAPLVARMARVGDADRAAFLASYQASGCYALPLPGPAKARLVVVNNVFWTKRSPHQSYGRAILDFLERELGQAATHGERVWVMSHVPPGDNAKASAKLFLKKGKTAFKPLLVDEWNDGLVRLLTSHAPTIAASFAGHVHRDAFRLIAGANVQVPFGLMRLGPSISPITGNNPGYQVFAYDRQSLEPLDLATRFLDLGAGDPRWDLEYVYSKAYGRGLRSPEDWEAAYRQLAACPDRKAAFEGAYDLRSAHIDEVTERTFPIYWRSLGQTGRAAFEAGSNL